MSALPVGRDPRSGMPAQCCSELLLWRESESICALRQMLDHSMDWHFHFCGLQFGDFLRFLTHRRRVHWARWRWSTGIGLTLQEAFLNDLPQLGDLGFLAANFGQKMIDWCHVCLCHTLLGLHCTRHREQHVKQMKQNAKTIENLFGENPQRIQNFLSIRHDSLERLNEDRAALKSGILTRQKLLHVAQLANDTNRRYQSQTNNGCFH